MACYKAAGAVKQNKAGSGAQPAEGRVTVLNREIRKGLAWKVDICTYHIKAAALRQEVEASGDGGELQPRGACLLDRPRPKDQEWPPLKSQSRFHTVRTFSHHGAPRGARRPVGTLLE